MQHDPDFMNIARDADAGVRANEAMQWLVRKDRGLSAGESAALLAWIEADDRNREAWMSALVCWQGLDGLRGINALAEDAEGIVARAKKRSRQRKTRSAVFAVLAAAAVIAVAFTPLNPWKPAGVMPSIASVGKSGYHVQESAARRMTLADGSVVQLNGDSRIEVAFTAEERRVKLVCGEAHFTVAKDPAHPFFVSANGVTVRAVGTAFNVRLAPDAGVEVLVTEGKILLHSAASTDAAVPVATESPALVAGQRAVVNPAGGDISGGISIGSVGALEIDQVLAWQSTRLFFSHTSLEEVVAAFNRYNTRKLVLGSPELKERFLSGVFRADNLDGLVRLLAITSDVAAHEKSPYETVLVAKK